MKMWKDVERLLECKRHCFELSGGLSGGLGGGGVYGEQPPAVLEEDRLVMWSVSFLCEHKGIIYWRDKNRELFIDLIRDKVIAFLICTSFRPRFLFNCLLKCMFCGQKSGSFLIYFLAGVVNQETWYHHNKRKDSSKSDYKYIVIVFSMDW